MKMKESNYGYRSISIPSGAIKSEQSGTELLFKYKFQFLLVRLRGYYGEFPYPGNSKFQFLLVRLRDSNHLRLH